MNVIPMIIHLKVMLPLNSNYAYALTYTDIHTDTSDTLSHSLYWQILTL